MKTKKKIKRRKKATIRFNDIYHFDNFYNAIKYGYKLKKRKVIS